MGHATVVLTVPLPFFLMLEDIAYSVAYTLAAIGVAKSVHGLGLLGAIVAVFEVGRVSRSIVNPYDVLGPLALEHLPLLLLLAATATTTLRYLPAKYK